MKNFWMCFVPLFVSVDALGALPIYIGLIKDIPFSKRKRILIQSLITASVAALLFLAIGRTLLRLIGITVPDFMVAGGILLFVISMANIVDGEKRQVLHDPETLGAVPIGVPLVTGPAVLTTSILLADSYGFVPTASAVLLNIGIAGIAFLFADPISNFLGNAGTKVFSKIAHLFLASIAVMLIRKGIVEIINGIMK